MNCSRTLGIRNILCLAWFFKIKLNMALSFHWGELVRSLMSIPFPQPSCPMWPGDHLGHPKWPIWPPFPFPTTKRLPLLALPMATGTADLQTVLLSNRLFREWEPGLFTLPDPSNPAEVLSTEDQGFHNAKQKALSILLVGQRENGLFITFSWDCSSKKIDKISVNSPSAHCSIKGEWLLQSPSLCSSHFPCGAGTVQMRIVPFPPWAFITQSTFLYILMLLML